MRILHVCHLYPDYLNLYGDFGNILAFRYRAGLREIGIRYHKVSIGDPLDLRQCDFLFIGGGQDEQQSSLRFDLLHEKKTVLQEAVAMQLPILAICGGYQLLGHFFKTKDGRNLEGLGILPIETYGQEKRLIGDTVCRSSFFGEGEDALLFGFENHSGHTKLLEGATPLAEVLHGYGNNDQDRSEGCRYQHVIGTYLHGSFLPKNPAVTDCLLEWALIRHEGEGYRLPEATRRVEREVRQMEYQRLSLEK